MNTATQDKANVSEMFGGEPNASVEKQIESMAVVIAVEDEELATVSKLLSERKANLEKLKADLSNLMRQNGIEKVSLENGLTPKATVKRKYFKATGVSDEQLQDWLIANDLGDIIKPTVNFNTMQSTLSHFDGELPEAIFNISDVPSITMYGKSKFLAERGER